MKLFDVTVHFMVEAETDDEASEIVNAELIPLGELIHDFTISDVEELREP